MVDSGGWNTVRQQNPDYEILDVAVDSTVGSAVFEFEVYSVNAAGRPSVSPLTSSFTCTGKSAKPSDVQTFTLDFDPHVGFQLKWVKIVPTAPEFADLDIRGYEIRRGTSWSSASVIGEFNTTSHVLGNIPMEEKAILDKVYMKVIDALEQLNTKKEEYIVTELNSFHKDQN